MEDFYIGPTPDKVYDDITSFDNDMFIANPIRAMKFAELLSYIPVNSTLRIKLMRAGKNSCFWKIADIFRNINSKKNKELEEDVLIKTIDDFLDELEENKEIKFLENEIEKIEEVLNIIFKTSGINETKGKIKNKVLQLVS